MRLRLPKILITGGAGFIGSAFVRKLIKQGSGPVVVDKITYAGDLKRLEEVAGKYKLYKADICDKERMQGIFKKENPCIVVNFAAETHVDRSIEDAGAFIDTNIKGTQILLDVSRSCSVDKFIQISTDECYGEIESGHFSENSPLRPNSPYAASKAAGDLLIKSYIRTYNFPAIIIRPCNNYGPWQYPEKFIPLAILKVLRNEKVPLYGDGRNVREWLYVDDCAEGIFQILKKGKTGEAYNLGSGHEERNITVAKIILKILNKGEDAIQFVKDRPGHDIRYSLSCAKVFKETGWRPKEDLSHGLEITVRWLLGHKGWLFSKWADVSSLYAKRKT